MSARILAALAFLIAVCAPALSIAQVASPDENSLARAGLFSRDRNVSVRQRPHPEYAPAGLHVGASTLYPTLSLSAEGNDNIYAVPSATTSDGIFHIAPGLFAQSNWSRNLLTGFARINDNEYASKGSEGTTDYAFGSAGRLDITRDTGADGGVSYERDTEPRTSPNSPASAKGPTRYSILDGYVGVAHAFNRLRLSARGEVRELDYDNVGAVGGGTIYEKDRNRTELTGTLRGEYAVSPATSVFVAFTGNSRDYHDLLATDIDRSSSGAQVEVGTNFDISRLVRGEVSVGYLDQDYDGRYRAVSGGSFRGRVEYFPTQITTLSLTFSRTVEESVIPKSAGYLSSNITAQVDHELMRNLLLTGSLSYGNDDYRGVDREDNRYVATLGLNYVLNRGIVLSAQFQHLSQDTGGLQRGLTYDINKLTTGVVLRY